MMLHGNTCPRCNGTGHDRKSQPVVKMVAFDPKVHTPYITEGEPDAPFTIKQTRYHQTIKQGSGCLQCGGIGVLDLTAT